MELAYFTIPIRIRMRCCDNDDEYKVKIIVTLSPATRPSTYTHLPVNN